jgi:hypothetical protein
MTCPRGNNNVVTCGNKPYEVKITKNITEAFNGL